MQITTLINQNEGHNKFYMVIRSGSHVQLNWGRIPKSGIPAMQVTSNGSSRTVRLQGKRGRSEIVGLPSRYQARDFAVSKVNSKLRRGYQVVSTTTV